MSQDRDLDVTMPKIEEYLVKPLNADLAFCGSWESHHAKSLKQKIRFDWSIEEPTDWVKEIDRASGGADGNWRELIQFGEQYGSHFLGPTILGASTGSGVIGHYWRLHLQKSLSDSVIDRYKWFILTRSDWFWSVPHPNLLALDEEKIYVFAGESYEGLNDRHLIIPNKYLRKFLEIPDLIFKHPTETSKSLKRLGLYNLNCERFYKFSVSYVGLLDKIVEVPYMGFLVRHANSDTRWASGVYNKKLGLFVKYPNERKMALRTGKYIKTSSSWNNVLSDPNQIAQIIANPQNLNFKKVRRACQILLDAIRYKNVRAQILRRLFERVGYRRGRNRN